jgi:hypothetical protein
MAKEYTQSTYPMAASANTTTLKPPHDDPAWTLHSWKPYVPPPPNDVNEKILVVWEKERT